MRSVPYLIHHTHVAQKQDSLSTEKTKNEKHQNQRLAEEMLNGKWGMIFFLSIAHLISGCILNTEDFLVL